MLQSSDSFYRERLEERLKNCCTNENCAKQKKLKLDERVILNEKLRKNEAGIAICEKIIEEKVQKIEEMELKLVNGTTGADSTHKAVNPPNLLEAYKEFIDHFTEDQISELRSVSFDKNKDAKFVTMLIKAMYKDNLSVLKNKSMTGRSRNKDKNNDAVTPEKLALFESFYRKRLQYSDKKERSDRSKKFKAHVNNAIQTLSRDRKKVKFVMKTAEEQFDAIISNSENDILVFKAVQRDMSIGELKVNLRYIIGFCA